MGTIHVPVTVANGLDGTKSLTFDALVDTGAFGLTLPRAWLGAFGNLPNLEIVEMETADQRVLTAEVRGPARVRIDGFRPFDGDVVFVDMGPGRDGRYEPLVGYTALELAGAVIDMVTHRLVRRRYYYAKVVRSAA
ncbi:MAG TPA: aspartyl protease family protein [Candidatus Binatia bacterium]|nr:aspartyl protease family protein [Candidatus Binatia bacterium]